MPRRCEKRVLCKDGKVRHCFGAADDRGNNLADRALIPHRTGNRPSLYPDLEDGLVQFISPGTLLLIAAIRAQITKRANTSGGVGQQPNCCTYIADH